MRKLIYTLIASIFLLNAQAQLDRSKLPEPGEPRPIEIGDYESFELKNGLKVFIIENHKLPRVTFRLQLDREPILEGEKAGYLGMVGQLMERGTTSRTKEQLDEEIDFIGASLSVGSGFAYASGLSKYSEKVLELMTDVIFNPSFPAEELEKIRTQTLSGIASSKDDPDAIASNLRSKVVYGKGHPYGEISTEETVKNITVEDIVKYHETYYKPNIAYLAVVGDIDKKEAQKLVKKYFSSWKSGEVPMPTYEDPAQPENNEVALVNRSSSVQSVINVAYPIELQPNTMDAIKVRILNQILGGGASARLFMNLREDKGYTYGSYSSISADDLVGSFNASASVRNEVTDSSVIQILYELERISTEPVSEEELSLAKNSISGSFARSLENPQTVASFAINTALYDLPEDYYATYLQKVNSVTAEDILAIAKKYIKPENAYITVVGKASDIAEKLQKFGAVKYYDTNGDPIDPSIAMLPEGLTADKVIENYIEAIGGRKTLEAIESVKMKMVADAMGNKLEMTRIHKSPQKLNLQISMGGNVMSEQIFDGENAKAMQMGQNLPLNDEQKEALALEAFPFPELYFKQMKVTTELIGVEEVNGQKSYVVEVTNPSGKKYSMFFSADNNLLVRKAQTMETPQGQSMTMNTDFLDYKEMDGIMVPQVIKIPLGPGFNAEAKLDTYEINGEVSDELFNTEK